MKKRILSIVLTVCMILALVPQAVFAADVVGDEREFHNLIKSTDAGKTLKMNKDYSCAMAFRIGKNMTIDLNGHVLSFSGRNAQTEIGYEDYKNKTVTIIDSNPNSVHSGQFAGLPNGGVIYAPKAVQGVLRIAEGSTLNMKGGTIYQSNAVNKGGAFVVYGTLNMTGGTIKNCTAGHGGGVHVQPGGTFTMSGGTIENCSSLERGGAVYNEGTFTMNGGTIDNCSTTIFGGGVYNCDNGKATLGGGTIKNCSADYGGGVFVQYGEFTMNGGTIEKCVAKTSEGSYGFGGGVNIYYANFTMTDGTIKDCTATYGESGALCLFANSTMTANGGSIQGTTVVDSLDGTISKIQTTSSDSYTRFYGKVVNEGIISGGAYYGDIQNRYNGTVSGTYYTVNFNLNGGSGSISPQRFVNISTATALRPTNPTRSGYVLKGWYNGSTKYTFTEPVTQSITLTAEWINTNVSTETDVKQAIDAGVPSIKLADDITLSNTLDLSDKDFTLDLNGHVLKGNIKLSDTVKPINPSKLTLIDSNPTATHTNSNLPLGGVLDGEINLDTKTLVGASLLYANGGTVTGQVILNDSNTQIVCKSATPTAFLGDVGSIGAIYGGMFYGGVTESCIEEKTVTFLSDRQPYARGVVESGRFAVAPIDPVKDGYVFAGWYFGNTKYSFTLPVIQGIVLNAKWVNEVTDEATLKAAINEGITNIKLLADINLVGVLDLSQKDITIDLNGYVISGANIAINTGNGKASLTLKDSRPTASHTDSSLPKGGVVTSKISMRQDGGGYNDCVLYANGGTVTSEFSTNTNAVAIKCTSNTPTAFKGKISGYTHLYGGIYYGEITSSVKVEGKKITFQNGVSTYAYEVVDSDNNTVAPISPSVMTGYQAFDGWYNGNTKYTFGSSLSQDITLTAKYKNPLTYNITYNLGGGTATNPTSYTVESDAITLKNPTKIGYTFTGWSGTGLNGENNMTVTIPRGSTGNRAYTAHFSQNSYTVAFDTVGGSSISDKAGVKWTDQVLGGITAPIKDGFEFIGWKCGDITVNANTKYSDLAANDTVRGVTLVARWRDKAAPTGEISIGTNKWNSFLNTITFGLFFKDTQTVTVTARDNSGEAVKIEYLLSDKALSEAELVGATFTSYTDSFSINPDNKYIVYARLTDQTGNVAYLSSNGIVLDATAPVIFGVENGKTYCEAQTVTAVEDYIESVKVNGTAVTLDENNRFVLHPTKGTQTIVVTDKAGNVSTEMTVTVNDGHTYECQSANGKYWKKCKFCGDETAKKDIPTIIVDGADVVCITQDYKFSFTLPQGATDPVYGYEFENKGNDGLSAIIENNKLFGIVPVTEYEPSENSFKVYAGAKTADGFEFFVSKTVVLRSEHTDAAPKDHICDICGATLSEHSGGEATCTNKAICEYCGNEYGELDSTNHNLEKIPAKAATVTEVGNKEYWHCKNCGKYFADENGKNEIELANTVIAKLPPEITEGKEQSVTEGEKKELAFRSNAAFSDFIRVELDGKTLDEKHYTVKEGSTVVTLKADYVATLSVGEHTIGIVSESGTATTAFTVHAKATVDNDTDSPPTGDNSHIFLWFTLLFVSGGLLTVTVVYGKRKTHSKY